MSRVDDLLTRFLAGDPRALARALTWVEAGSDDGLAVVAAVAGRREAARARVVGVTGSPGVGKSTLVDALVGAWRGRGARVAVLAVDPSSPYSGGALLGDRVRMERGAADATVFVRSMANRGRTGGLAPMALEALALFEGFGFDVVLLETVGVGQAEVDVVAVADTVVLAVAPGQGDDVQAAKAGLMEIADVFALTKADRPDAPRLARELADTLALHGAEPGSWLPRVVPVAVGAPPGASPAVGPGGGVTDLVAAIDAHAAHQAASGGDRTRRADRSRQALQARAERRLRAALAAVPADVLAGLADGTRGVEDEVSALLRAAASAGARRAADADVGEGADW